MQRSILLYCGEGSVTMSSGQKVWGFFSHNKAEWREVETIFTIGSCLLIILLCTAQASAAEVEQSASGEGVRKFV